VSVSRAACATLVTLLLLSPPALARMYQWVSPETGGVQLSGDPPAWYRSGYDGPRVWVFEDGRLVDDTAIAVPRTQREALRDAAFEDAEQRRRTQALKRLERAARREERRREETERVAELRRAEEEAARRSATGQAPATAATPESRTPRSAATPVDQATVERLKAIIREFDRRVGVAP
jgi:hypothetical protein